MRLKKETADGKLLGVEQAIHKGKGGIIENPLGDGQNGRTSKEPHTGLCLKESEHQV